MDLPFPEDFTHVGQDSWQAALGGSTNSPHWGTGGEAHSPVGTQGDFQPWHQLFLF